MNTHSDLPDENIARVIAKSMTGENILSLTRLTTGDQHFVFAVKTENEDYVLRMTKEENRKFFVSALYWQDKLFPLGIPLAKFIQYDLDARYSQFPALLMKRLPGDDLCNVYAQLNNLQKKNLANEMVCIQKKTMQLPHGSGFGIVSSYEEEPEFYSWHDFLMQRLNLFMDAIEKADIFDPIPILNVISIANEIRDSLNTAQPTPFLWDASERNVLIHDGKISGIVDVDELCFGDPLFVIGLTHTALKNDGHDTLYAEYWAQSLNLDEKSKIRLEFYRLFYVVVFMRKHSMLSANNHKIIFNTEQLKNMFSQSIIELKTLLK